MLVGTRASFKSINFTTADDGDGDDRASYNLIENVNVSENLHILTV